ncbi:MAG TPA: hypothetical protein VLF91_05460 [Candidatus Saccharimonadales bacterium]|nr:hypothetical protein [Candidatus Saccharimonadales bacterium]
MKGILNVLGGLPRDVFGPRVDTGWGIMASICFTVVVIAFAIGGYRSIHEWVKAADVRFNKERVEQHNLHRPKGTPPRNYNWVMARKEQVRSWRFVIPFGLLVLAVGYWWIRYSFDLATYFKLAAAWLVFQAVVLRPWWIAAVVWTQRKLVKTKESTLAEQPFGDKSVGWAYRHYLNWGLQKSTFKRQPFIGLFRFLNPVIRLFRLRWLQPRLIRPLFACAFYALTWAVSMVAAVFVLEYAFDHRKKVLKPEWASTYAEEPDYNKTGAILDTGPDAAAAQA